MEPSEDGRKATAKACGGVLIVDDDEDIRDALDGALQLEGYDTALAANGREALDALRVKQPCVILLDLMMPVMSGLEFLSVLRADPSIAQTPVVIVSAYDRPDGSDRANATLRKPFDLDVLMEVIGRYCGRAVTSSAEAPPRR